MSARRKPVPLPPAPTENQIGEAMLAFERAKVRYLLLKQGHEFVVNVTPEQYADFPVGDGMRKVFTDEATARRWREREIIREAITTGMRARP